jgi:hypothetical protein
MLVFLWWVEDRTILENPANSGKAWLRDVVPGTHARPNADSKVEP